VRHLLIVAHGANSPCSGHIRIQKAWLKRLMAASFAGATEVIGFLEIEELRQ